MRVSGKCRPFGIATSLWRCNGGCYPFSLKGFFGSGGWAVVSSPWSNRFWQGRYRKSLGTFFLLEFVQVDSQHIERPALCCVSNVVMHVGRKARLYLAPPCFVVSRSRNIGVLEKWSAVFPILHHSTTPTL